MTTVLLGPQRFRMTAGEVASAIAPDGPVATVTAGWRDREKDDAQEIDRARQLVHTALAQLNLGGDA